MNICIITHLQPKCDRNRRTIYTLIVMEAAEAVKWYPNYFKTNHLLSFSRACPSTCQPCILVNTTDAASSYQKTHSNLIGSKSTSQRLVHMSMWGVGPSLLRHHRQVKRDWNLMGHHLWMSRNLSLG